MQIKISTDALSGLLFAGIGAAALAIGSRYQIGTAARMGPGYFPVLISGVLVVLGTAQLVVGMLTRSSPSYGQLRWGPLLVVTAAIVAFGLLIESSLLLACIAVVIVARFAQRPYDWREVAILAAGLAIASAALFVYALGLPLRLHPF